MVKVFISGRPGVGKTTVFNKVIQYLKLNGVTVGGFTCPEVRVRGRRIGFDIVDIATGKRARLARIYGTVGEVCVARVGKYCVLDEAGDLGLESIRCALSNADVVAIDEVGPMELKIPKLRTAIENALKSHKHVLAVVHRSLAKTIENNYKGILIWITEINRGNIYRKIADIFMNNIFNK